jgi:hypothetical protein
MMDEFWDELDDVLTAIDGAEDATAAGTLIEFLELHRETWGAVVQSMAASAARRGMIERACLILSEGKFDDGIPG